MELMNNIDREFINSENKEAFSYEELKDVDVEVLSDFRHEINTEELLFDSCRNNDHTFLQKLIDIDDDVDINTQDYLGNTALMDACAHDSFECAKILIKNSADINAQSDFGDTALDIAKIHRYKNIVELLIKNGAHE